MTTIINGLNGGKHAIDGPLTVSATDEAAPGLLRNVIDERIVKIRPMSTPIDQLSRCAGARRCGSMTVEYYSVDTKKTETKVSTAVASGRGNRKANNIYTHTIKTDDDLLFEPSETVLLPEVAGGADESTGISGGPLVLYVISRLDAGGLEVICINPVKDSSGNDVIPAIAAGARIIRMGRAASELDVQTAQFQALPTKSSNNCQIFKMQCEESTFHKIANKEIGWSFSDQEEAAIIDMRAGMEKNYLFGAKAKIFDPVKNENIYLTGGIWNQVPRSIDVTVSALDETHLLDICRKAFTDNAGSKRKILIAGTGLIDAISRIQLSKVVQASETLVKWGIEFKEIRSNFGTLYVIHSEIFDQCGHADDGLVIDPDYLTKYVHVPFHTERLDLRRSGTRNTDAVVITEASCVVLRYPTSHLRIKGVRPAAGTSTSAASGSQSSDDSNDGN